MSPSSLARELLDNYWDGRLPVDPVRIATAMGIEAYLSPSLDVSGEYNRYGRNQKPEIVISSNEPLVRRRFTAAHELGHYALGHDDGKKRDPAKHYSLSIYDPHERDANQFAAELLMPAEAISQAMRDHRASDLKWLATSFGVSGLAMQYRLKSLGYMR